MLWPVMPRGVDIDTLLHLSFTTLQNSSLVLTADTRTKDYSHDPSGEPESLYGRMKVRV